MLPKAQRLRARKDFDALWKRGRSVYGHALGIRFTETRRRTARFGVVAGLKVSKRSVERNRIRRRIREALRREFAPRIKGYDVAVLARPGSARRSYDEVVSELAELFRRARLL
ncbi:ribonuclease P protein component [Candidatus Uhrbacteria bacterium]|nr:ribonuclease P protein component [Candidatus Uhrbacteria bacterium]